MAEGVAAGGSMEFAQDREWITHLKKLEASQIVELFDGFCSDCHALLKSRLLTLSSQNPDSSDSPSVISTVSSLANTVQNHRNHERTPVSGKPQMRDLFDGTLSPGVQNNGSPSTDRNGNLEEEEWRRYSQVGRKKNFSQYERVDGRNVNVLQGLELHTGVFSAEEQKKIVESVYEFQRMGRKRQLMARTYSEPSKWMRGKGRVTIQFGCCYNYAVDKDGNPPGIIRDEEVDPLPPIFKQMIKRMVRWHVLPPTCVPNSCIVNIYDEGDCIPPHIDHHDFLRPFCTVSFLTECNILFGTSLKVAAPGEFSGPVSIPLPVGSVLVLKGNGADIAKHCIPAVPARRISVTFRRMDDSKIPYNFSHDAELLNIKPLIRPSPGRIGAATQDRQETKLNGRAHKQNEREPVNSSFSLAKDEFPPLGGKK